MAVNALIKFTQLTPGPGVGADGQAMLGVVGTLVTVANVNNTNVDKAQFELLYVPPTSALTVGVKQAYGATLTWTFTPDVTEGFVVRLRVKDVNGNESVDDRVFGVVETSGRFIPPFAKGAALNVLGALYGWHKYLRAFLKAIDVLDNSERGAKGTNLTDASVTIQVTQGPWRALPAATLSANRSITLGTTGAFAGDKITITRLDVTAFTLAIVNGGVGAGTLITYPVSKLGSGIFQFDGTNWALKTLGSL